MAKKKSKKVIRCRRPLSISVGMIIFFAIFARLIFSVCTYLKQGKIQFYEMADGGTASSRIYNGLILREEQVRTASRSGYINYHLRGGKRASAGSRIYSLDETGDLEALSRKNAEEGASLSDDSLSDLKGQLISFALSLQNRDFGTVYDTKVSLGTSVMKYPSLNTLDQLDRLAEQSGAVFEQVHSDISGVVSYGIDSFESMITLGVNTADFDRSTYVETIHKLGDLADSGSPTYRVVTPEKWSIAFPPNDEDMALYNDKTALRVAFHDYPPSTPTVYSTFTGKDGAAYGKLDFSKYMEQFISDRFVDSRIKVDKADGPKIPVNAIADKNFCLIPLKYMTQGGDSLEDDFYKEVYAENDASVVFALTTVYYSDDEFYYVDTGKKNGFKAGDYVVRPESSDRYQVGRTASLKGAYNINKGYIIFEQIGILDSSSEYYTVRKNMKYDLSAYDHIVLGASMVEEGQLLYQWGRKTIW